MRFAFTGLCHHNPSSTHLGGLASLGDFDRADIANGKTSSGIAGFEVEGMDLAWITRWRSRTLLSFLALVPVAHLKEGEGQDCKTLKVRAVQAL